MQKMLMRISKMIALLALLLNSALVLAGALQIREGYVRELPPGQSTSAAFMTLVNETARPIAIVAATSDAAQMAEIHAHRHVDGAMRMELVRRLVVPAHGKIELAPGAYHLMLINLKRSLRAGDSVAVTLIDEEGKSYVAHIPVVKMVGAGQ